MNAFLEDRVGAHLSVDHFWNNRPRSAKQDEKLRQLAIIAEQEEFPLAAWACATAGDARCDVTDGLIASETTTNPFHADLRKTEFLVICQADVGTKSRGRKARIFAQAVAERFNSLAGSFWLAPE